VMFSAAMASCANRPPPVNPGEGRTYQTPGGATVYHRNECGFGSHENAGNRFLRLYNVAFAQGGKLRDQPEIRLFSDDQFFSFLEKRYGAEDAAMGERGIMALGRIASVARDACSNSENSRGEQAAEAMKLHDDATAALIDWAVKMEAASTAEELEPIIREAILQGSALGDRYGLLPKPYCVPGRC